MHRHLITWALRLLALLVSLPAWAAAPTHIAASLVADGVAAPGSTTTLAVVMRPDPGWHGYWSNPGDAGQGPTFQWTLPRGASAGTPRFPVPQTLEIAGLMNHVYEHAFAILVPLTVPGDARPGSAIPVRLALHWLACTDQICVPEQGELAVAVPISASAAPNPRFDAWRQALPAPLGSPARFALGPDKLRIAIPLPAGTRLEAPHLFVSDEGVADYAAPSNLPAPAIR